MPSNGAPRKKYNHSASSARPVFRVSVGGPQQGTAKQKIHHPLKRPTFLARKFQRFSSGQGPQSVVLRDSKYSHRSQNLERDPPMAVYPESITETTYQVTVLSEDLCLSTIAKTKMSIAIPPSTKANKPQHPWRVPTPEDEKRVLTPDKPKSSSSDPSRPMTWTETSFSGTHKPWPGLEDSASPEESQDVRSTQVVPLDYLMSWPGLDWEEVIRELTGVWKSHRGRAGVSSQVITDDVALDAVSEHFEVDFFVDKAIRKSLAVHSQLRQQAPRSVTRPVQQLLFP
ncbi:MAG: hypothetical protein Q9186_000601 [Xanthomendoza sp. 1 TL-2023]